MAALPEDLRMAVTLREIEEVELRRDRRGDGLSDRNGAQPHLPGREAIATELRPLLGTREDRRW